MNQRATFDPDKDFDLLKSPVAVACLILTVLIAIYALLDGVYWPGDNYAGELPYGLFVTVGAVTGVITGIVLRFTMQPLAESVGLALVLGIAMTLAAVPGALRVNAMTTESGMTTYHYVLAEKGVLKPEQDHLPVIEWPVYAQFWLDQPLGSHWKFRMCKGKLGFWQYDSRAVLKQISIDAVWRELN